MDEELKYEKTVCKVCHGKILPGDTCVDVNGDLYHEGCWEDLSEQEQFDLLGIIKRIA